MTTHTLAAVLVRLVGAHRVLMVDPPVGDSVVGDSVVHAADAVGARGSVVVLSREAAVVPVHGRVQVVVGDPMTTLPHLRTDDDTTFEVVVLDISAASAADAVQYVEWAMVLGRTGTALAVTGSTDATESLAAVRDLLSRHPRIDATTWEAGDSSLALAVITDQP